MFIISGTFWLYAGERAIKTTAQAALAVLGTGALGIIDADWLNVASVAALAGIVSVLTSITGFTPGSEADSG